MTERGREVTRTPHLFLSRAKCRLLGRWDDRISIEKHGEMFEKASWVDGIGMIIIEEEEMDRVRVWV